MSTPTKAARGTLEDAGSSPATSTTRSPWLRYVLAALALALAVGSGYAFSLLVHHDPEQRFLDVAAVEHQAGYEGRIIGAGHWSCTALHFGMTEDQLIDYGAREGLAGDLYTRDSVVSIVRAAHQTLCPAAELPGQIHP